MLRQLLNIIFILCFFTVTVAAQELNCKIRVQHGKITGVDPQVFVGMEKDITTFMNSHKWTSDEYGTNEKIDVNFIINLTARITGDDAGYLGTVSIQATRPVFNASYNSPTINYLDKDFVFHYSQFAPLQFDDRNIVGADVLASNLTAVLAFYAYIVIGLDYDSFAPYGGTDYLKKAQNIVNGAPDSKSVAGWKPVDGPRNRYWLADQLLSPRFQDVRAYWYSFHREGLDNMYTKSDSARQKILAGISKLSQVNKENPSSMLIPFFFTAKSDEIVKILSSVPKNDRGPYVSMLIQMDVSNISRYNSLK